MNLRSQEINFAQKRRLLAELLAPYLLNSIREAHFPSFYVQGGAPLKEAVPSQSFVCPARIQTDDHTYHEIQLVIQHTGEWDPAVTVFIDEGGVDQTVVVRGSVEDSITELQSLIDTGIERLRMAHVMR